MIKEIYTNQEDKMKKALDALRREFMTLRAGRATPAECQGAGREPDDC